MTDHPRLEGKACILGASRPRIDTTKGGTMRSFEFGCARYNVYLTPAGNIEKIAKRERTNHTSGYFALSNKGTAFREVAAAFLWALGQPTETTT